MTEVKEANRVTKGPCATLFSELALCGKKVGAKERKARIEACPSETDRLIKCMSKHPLYYGGWGDRK
eukprot:CAMPEP_0113529296 /NCGR_PEP_ID=MMETSP0015_2-20120614/2317_1 /TAXON_ID=2838 /ORGANISM="Odontella" /LENGTH=66 /DNA_ID=CAMNT_0000427915 /DNA_START=221 /DNA_END=421 /DNA_ORIENTATION=+ /assembly_acc=CAM_ASM_000160